MREPVQDPGWLPALPLAPLGLLSLFALRLLRRRGTLIVLRALFVWWVFALFLILYGVVQIDPGPDGPEPPWIPLLLGAYVLAGLGGVLWGRRHALVGDTAELAAASYRAKFFIRVGLALSPALVGFAFVFLSGRLAYTLVGLAASLVGLSLSAPTRGDIERHQRRIIAEGSPVSLLEALLAPSPSASDVRRIQRELRARYRRRGRR